MFIKFTIVVIILSSQTRWINSEKASVPIQICKRNAELDVTYQIYPNHSMIQDSQFTDAGEVLSWIRRQRIFMEECNDTNLDIMENRTINRDVNSFTIVYVNYKFTIGIKKEVNCSLLMNQTDGKSIDDCHIAIYEDIFAVSLGDSTVLKKLFSLNHTGNESIHYKIIPHDKEPPCFEEIVACPSNSERESNECECVCSKGTYFDEKLMACTLCPKDMYQEMKGMFECTRCKEGYNTHSITGSQDSTACKGISTTSPKTSNTTQTTAWKSTTPAVVTSNKSLGIALAICATSLVLIIVVGIIIFRHWRKKRRKELDLQDIELFKKRFTIVEISNSDEEIEDSESQPITTLGHLAKEVERRGLEIAREHITLTETRLGRGQFGVVQQVVVRKPNEPEMLCAAKMARGSSRVSAEDLLCDMQDELEIHLKLERTHENVVNLIGICSDNNGPFYLIMEYCGNGSLIEYLRKHENIPEYVNTASRETLSQEWKLNCAVEICCGMKFLASHKIVHRDLAARNVLLDNNTVAKISDFGMAKDVYLKSYYTQRHEGTFPLRWMAIESIQSLDFTEKSDVWSFGVLCWEIFTDGKHPYFDIIEDQNVAGYILAGKKLKRPHDCPKFFYNVMLKCWSNKHYNRPSFRELYEDLSRFVQNSKKGKTTKTRRLSQSMLNTFSETKKSFKRKLSRKDSGRSMESLEGLGRKSRNLSQSSERMLDDVEQGKVAAIINRGGDEDDTESDKDIATQSGGNNNTKKLKDQNEVDQESKIDDLDGQQRNSPKTYNKQNFSLDSETPHDSLNEDTSDRKIDDLSVIDLDNGDGDVGESLEVHSADNKVKYSKGGSGTDENASMDGNEQEFKAENRETLEIPSETEINTNEEGLSNASQDVSLNDILPDAPISSETDNYATLCFS